jgi:hypothetical protein
VIPKPESTLMTRRPELGRWVCANFGNGPISVLPLFIASVSRETKHVLRTSSRNRPLYRRGRSRIDRMCVYPEVLRTRERLLRQLLLTDLPSFSSFLSKKLVSSHTKSRNVKSREVNKMQPHACAYPCTSNPLSCRLPQKYAESISRACRDY